jgi:hypothetical protein
MPNWCDNELVVSGPTSEVGRFLAAAKGEETVLSFERLVPPPAEYPPLPGCEKSDRDWYMWRVTNWGTKWDADEVTVEELDPEQAWHDEQSDGDGVDGQLRSVGFTFDTAWGPPREWVVAASAQFPRLRFRLTYWEPCMEFHGYLNAHAGEVQDQAVAPFYGHPQIAR